MPRGGHAASGPLKDPNSLKSAKIGYAPTALPSEGYDGEIPPFPLPSLPVYEVYYEDGKRCRDFDEKATEARADREWVLWDWAWHTPQACAWIGQPWRWHAVAMWARTAALCESADATASDKNSLHRFADQIGLSPAGLQYNGWKVAANQLAGREKPAEAPAARPASARDRLKALDGGKTA